MPGQIKIENRRRGWGHFLLPRCGRMASDGAQNRAGRRHPWTNPLKNLGDAVFFRLDPLFFGENFV